MAENESNEIPNLCKTLEWSFEVANYSDYRLNFTGICTVLAMQGFLDWLPPKGNGYPFPQNDQDMAVAYT